MTQRPPHHHQPLPSPPSRALPHLCCCSSPPSLPLQVALSLMKRGQPVKVGDIVQYVVCEKEGAKSPADRAYHPDDVAKCTDGSLKLDIEWYLAQQVGRGLSHRL